MKQENRRVERSMNVLPNESHPKWVAALGLALFFLLLATLSFRDGDRLLGLLFLVLAVALVGAEFAKFQSQRRAGKDSGRLPESLEVVRERDAFHAMGMGLSLLAVAGF
ncbi:MAG: hypothetical protein ABWY04_17395 [Arthrobacter sp.]